MRGHEYAGSLAETVTGKQCQQWSSNSPHKPNTDFVIGANFPEGNVTAAENYCRNPDPNFHSGVWCYTTDPRVRWEMCSVPMCAANGNLAAVSASEMTYIVSGGALYSTHSLAVVSSTAYAWC